MPKMIGALVADRQLDGPPRQGFVVEAEPHTDRYWLVAVDGSDAWLAPGEKLVYIAGEATEGDPSVWSPSGLTPFLASLVPGGGTLRVMALDRLSAVRFAERVAKVRGGGLRVGMVTRTS